MTRVLIPETLDGHFWCAHFEREILGRHCLRRQLERKQTKHPKTMKLVATEPANGYCATTCAQGRGIRALFAVVPKGACDRCGTAYVGAAAAAAPCGECEAARVEAGKEPPRGFLPPPAGPPEQSRIWNGEAPDTPLGPPPATSKHSGVRPAQPATFGTDPERAAAAGRRAREAAAAPRIEVEKRAEAPVTHPPAPRASVNPEGAPARPAEEETMAEKTCSECGKALRGDNTRGHCGDRRACAARAGGKGGAKPAPPPRATKPRPEKRGGARRTNGREDLDDLPVEELIEWRDEIEAAIARRVTRAEEDLAALRAAVSPKVVQRSRPEAA